MTLTTVAWRTGHAHTGYRCHDDIQPGADALVLRSDAEREIARLRAALAELTDVGKELSCEMEHAIAVAGLCGDVLPARHPVRLWMSHLDAALCGDQEPAVDDVKAAETEQLGQAVACIDPRHLQLLTKNWTHGNTLKHVDDAAEGDVLLYTRPQPVAGDAAEIRRLLDLIDEIVEFRVPHDIVADVTLATAEARAALSAAPDELVLVAAGEPAPECRPSSLAAQNSGAGLPWRRPAVAPRARRRAPTMSETFDAVRAELERAVSKFPTWPTDPLHASGVVQEEAGELAKAVLQAVYEPHKSSPDDARSEAVQTAAMAIRWIASADIYDWTPGAQHEQGQAGEVR